MSTKKVYIKEIKAHVQLMDLDASDLKTILNFSYETDQQLKCLVVFSMFNNPIGLLSRVVLLDNARDREAIVEKLFNYAVKSFGEVSRELAAYTASQATASNKAQKGLKVAEEEQPDLADNQRLRKVRRDELIKQLKSKIVGQDIAIEKITSALVRAMAGVVDCERPLASFLLAGPTGTGKTETAKALAKILFGDEWKEHLVTVNGPDFMLEHAATRLLGAPPSYIGFDAEIDFLEKLKKNENCIILFDEMEKAHSKVLDIFLRILDEGKVQDNTGKEIDCTKSIIVFTSNLGTDNLLKNKLGFSNPQALSDIKLDSDIINAIKTKLRPEFINRIDEVIVYKALTLEDINKIVLLERDAFLKRAINSSEIKTVISDKIVSYIIKEGYSTEFGARGIKRLFDGEIGTAIADCILETPKSKSTIEVILEDNKIVAQRKTKRTSKKS